MSAEQERSKGKAVWRTRAVLALCVLLLMHGAARASCIMVKAHWLNEAKPAEYILYGEVVDHVLLPPSDECVKQRVNCFETALLRVKVLSAIHAPDATPPAQVDLDIWTVRSPRNGFDCAYDQPSTLKAIQKTPLGTRVAVAAREEQAPWRGVPRLHVGTASRDFAPIFFTLPANADIARLTRTPADYAEMAHTRYPPPEQFAFEVQKDMVRLKNATSASARGDIFDRMARTPQVPDWLYNELVDRYRDGDLAHRWRLYNRSRLKHKYDR